MGCGLRRARLNWLFDDAIPGAVVQLPEINREEHSAREASATLAEVLHWAAPEGLRIQSSAVHPTDTGPPPCDGWRPGSYLPCRRSVPTQLDNAPSDSGTTSQ